MTLRERPRHQTLGVQKLGVTSEEYWDYQPDQHVMTVDGYLGVVQAVVDGPVPGTEEYQVVLNDGMGGGTYTASQLSPAPSATASLTGTAAEDYPELGSILIDRPDPAGQKVYASRHTAMDGQDAPENNGDDSESSPDDDTPDDASSSTDSDDEDASDGDGLPGASAALLDTMIRTAVSDPDFRFHITAAWRDVVAKAKRIRSEGRLRVTMASDGLLFAEIKGDHHVYETGLQRLPGHTAAQSWSCGCKWGAYHWGADDDFSRFAGRMCSHALALQYEAQSRGMFGRDVEIDEHKPTWVPRKIVIRYDIDSGQNQLVPATASLTAEAPLRVVGRAATAEGEDAEEVALAMRVASWDSYDDDDDEDGDHRTDWDRVHPHLNGVHRGMNIALPPHVHTVVHNPNRPASGRAQALMDEMKESLRGSQTGGLGMHWSADPSQADHYAHVSHPTATRAASGYTGTHVILHAATPPRSSIETDDATLKSRDVIGFDGHEDQEVPIREGEPVHITGVSWKEPHKTEWTRHNFNKPQEHIASVYSPFGEPQGSSYQLPRTPGATQVRTPWENPASAGPLAGADPVGWNRTMPLEPMLASVADDMALFEPDGAEAALHEEPEGALPATDGTQDEGVPTTAGLRTHALKDFSAAEREALINEGAGTQAANLDRLKIEGTHYEDLEQVLAAEEDAPWLI